MREWSKTVNVWMRNCLLNLVREKFDESKEYGFVQETTDWSETYD